MSTGNSNRITYSLIGQHETQIKQLFDDFFNTLEQIMRTKAKLMAEFEGQAANELSANVENLISRMKHDEKEIVDHLLRKLKAWATEMELADKTSQAQAGEIG